MSYSTRSTLLCFTDVLCGYCYVADARFVRLQAEYGDQIELSYHFMPVYGDVRRRLEQGGRSPGVLAAKARELAQRYTHVQFHPDLFHTGLPTSSMPAHLYLRAVQLLHEEGLVAAREGHSAFECLMWELRLAFFRDLRDISRRDVLDELAGSLGIPVDEVARVIDEGRPYAELAHDAQLVRRHDVSMTPTLVFETGHRLEGDVPYDRIESTVLHVSSGEDARRGETLDLAQR